MAKNRLLTDNDRRLIAKVYLEDRERPAKIIRDEVEARLRRQNPDSPYDWPGISIVQKELAIIRKPTEAGEQKLDGPWSVGCITEYDISPDALPVVMEIYKRRVSQNNFGFSIRLALWVVKLHKTIIDTADLERFAHAYAQREQIDSLFRSHTSTADLDMLMMKYQENPQEFKDFSLIG